MTDYLRSAVSFTDILLEAVLDYSLCLGIVTGNPGVFQGYPDPDPVKTHTRSLGMGFTGSGYGYPSGCIDMSRVGQV